MAIFTTTGFGTFRLDRRQQRTQTSPAVGSPLYKYETGRHDRRLAWNNVSHHAGRALFRQLLGTPPDQSKLTAISGALSTLFSLNKSLAARIKAARSLSTPQAVHLFARMRTLSARRHLKKLAFKLVRLAYDTKTDPKLQIATIYVLDAIARSNAINKNIVENNIWQRFYFSIFYHNPHAPKDWSMSQGLNWAIFTRMTQSCTGPCVVICRPVPQRKVLPLILENLRLNWKKGVLPRKTLRLLYYITIDHFRSDPKLLTILPHFIKGVKNDGTGHLRDRTKKLLDKLNVSAMSRGTFRGVIAMMKGAERNTNNIHFKRIIRDFIRKAPQARKNKTTVWAVTDHIKVRYDRALGIRLRRVKVLRQRGSAGIRGLIRFLRDRNSDVRYRAAWALGDIGSAALPRLIACLRSRKWIVRQFAAEAIGTMGPKAKAAIPRLVRLLRDSNAHVRQFAAHAVAKIGPDGKVGIAALIKLLSNNHVDVKLRAAWVLTYMGTHAKAAVPSLIVLLDDRNKDVRHRAAWALGKIGPTAKKAIPRLIVLRLDGGHNDRRIAAKALERIGPASLPQVIQLLSNSDSRVRTYAAEELRKHGSKAEAALPQLITCLSDSDRDVKGRAASVLGTLGPKARAAIPALMRLLHDGDGYVRDVAARALSEIGPAAIPGLIKLLSNSDRFIKSRAASALGMFGPRAKAGIPALIKLVRGSDTYVRREAAETLSKIGPAAVPGLIKLLSDKDAAIRSRAAQSLGEIGRHAKAAIPRLIALLRDSNAHVKKSAARALGTFDSETKKTIPHLVALFRDRDWDVKVCAEKVLSKIGSAAVPRLIAELHDSNADVKNHAASTLYKITKMHGIYGYHAKAAVFGLIKMFRGNSEYFSFSALVRIGTPAVPELARCLADGSKKTRIRAARALGKIGSDAKMSVPALIKCLYDGNEKIRSSAAWALSKIGHHAKAALPRLLELLRRDPSQDVREAATWAYNLIDKEIRLLSN